MSTWDGRRSQSRYFSSWDDAVRFLRSDSFRLMRDVRTLTVKQLNPTARATRTPPAAELEERAQREHDCDTCGAIPRQPCTAPDRAVHDSRFRAAKLAAQAEAGAGREEE
jgi:hypothetical protein